MAVLTTILSFILLIGLVASPILIICRLNKRNSKYKFIVYLAVGIAATALLTLTFAWWSVTSDEMLLAHYGYNMDGMNEAEFYGQVAPENRESVKSLEASVMGIGWPLKALLMYVVYLPYFFIVYFVLYVMRKKAHLTPA